MPSPPPPSLVRNISLPSFTPSPHPQRVPRVSSFSTIIKPSHLVHSYDFIDQESDGLVPQLPSSYDPASDHSLPSDSDSTSATSPLPTPPSSPPYLANIPPPSLPPPRLTRHHHHHHHLTHCIILLSTLFTPPHAKHTPHLHRRYLSITILTLLISIPFSLLSLSHPSLRPATLLIALCPLVARPTSSLTLATLLTAAGVLCYVLRAASVVSPVMLVWVSLVPVLVSAGLGTRAGVVAAVVTAGVVGRVEVEVKVGHGVESRGVGSVVAGWVLFLGIVGLVLKHVREVVEVEERAGYHA